MQFDESALLLFLFAPAAALLLVAWTLRWRSRQTARLVRDGGGDIAQRRSRIRPIIKAALVASALTLLAVALARPQFGARETEISQEGIAVAIALDVSLSMAVEDQAPNRLGVAQVEIAGLLDRLQGDRVALVLYARDALVRFPLTRDTGAAGDIVAALEPGEALLQPGSNVAAAIDSGRALLADSDAVTKVILIVGDGESLQGDALAAARRAAAEGIRIYAGGVGTEAGGTIPVRDPVTREIVVKLDAGSGLPVVSRLDAAALEALAAAGSGRFVRLDRAGTLSTLASDFAALEASLFRVRTDSMPIERFQIFVAIGLALILLEPLIGAAARAPRSKLSVGRGRRRVLLFSLLMLTSLAAAACASTAFERNEDGNRFFAEARYDEAFDAYRDAQADAPQERRLNLNAGQALHARQEYERAVSETGRALGESDAIAARALYQIGNHRLAQGDFVGARNAYIESLLIDSTDFDAKFNLELVTLQLINMAPPPGGNRPTPSDGDGAVQDGAAPSSEAQGQPADGAEEAEGGPGAAGPSAQDQQPGSRGTAGEADSQDQQEGDALQQALEALERDDPTVEQALAILDALRQRVGRQPLGSGSRTPAVSGDNDF